MTYANNNPQRHLLRTAQGVAAAKQRRLVMDIAPRAMPLVPPAATCQYFGKRRTKCGKPSIEGFSYCAEHKARCYVGVPKRKHKVSGDGPRVYRNRLGMK